jgi:hypothetical protein
VRFSSPSVLQGFFDRFTLNRCTRRLGKRSVAIVALLAVAGFSTGCGALLQLGGAETSAIVFTTGELRATEEVPLMEVHEACEVAFETLGYQEITAELDAEKILWQAKTAGGDPVDIRLKAAGPRKTAVRIRIGVVGDEARSRLVLELIRQSL